MTDADDDDDDAAAAAATAAAADVAYRSATPSFAAVDVKKVRWRPRAGSTCVYVRERLVYTWVRVRVRVFVRAFACIYGQSVHGSTLHFSSVFTSTSRIARKRDSAPSETTPPPWDKSRGS